MSLFSWRYRRYLAEYKQPQSDSWTINKGKYFDLHEKLFSKCAFMSVLNPSTVNDFFLKELFKKEPCHSDIDHTAERCCGYYRNSFIADVSMLLTCWFVWFYHTDKKMTAIMEPETLVAMNADEFACEITSTSKMISMRSNRFSLDDEKWQKENLTDWMERKKTAAISKQFYL